MGDIPSLAERAEFIERPPLPKIALPVQKKRGERLLFIDGIRGITAFLIVLTHIYWEISPNGDGAGLPPTIATLLHPFAFANKVGVFIVISGFGLARTALRNGGKPGLPGGWRSFLIRRANRILLPYYAALLLSLLLIAAIPVMHTPTGVRWDCALPLESYRTAILAHLLLVHNLNPAWITCFDPPLWTLAIEWQMYFLFPFLLLPLWRRFGLWAAIGTGFLLGYLPHYLLPSGHNFDWTNPWYLGLFCLGMLAASLSQKALQAPALALRLLRPIIGITGLGVVAAIWAGATWCSGERRLWVDLLVGFFFASLILYGTITRRQGRPSRVLRLLENRITNPLGRLSFSLYLTHFPLLSLLHAGLRTMFPSTLAGNVWQLALLYVLGIPLCLFAAHLFSRVFERPFLQQDVRDKAMTLVWSRGSQNGAG